jgi:2'-5' RNA ligase
VRLFFALWPPAKTADALAQWAHEVMQQTGGSPMRTENIHLTLAFLGEADAGRAIAVARGIKGSRHALPIDAARYVKRNEMVWVGPANLPLELAALAADLRTSLEAGAFVIEERPFAAHVTLVRKARMPKSLPPLPRVEWPVNEILLVRSHTSPKGSTYEPVERFPLQA